MAIYKKFNKLSRLVQLLLLVIPFVNWLTEVLVRWSYALNKKSLINLVLAILATFGGIFFGFIDFICCLLFNHLIFAK